MKKGMLLVAAVVAVTFASCKKEWTCECTSSCTSGGTTTSSSVTYTFTAKKKDAKAACDAYSISSGSCSYTCDLK